MNAKKTKTDDREFSERLRLAISADFIQAHPDLTVVDGSDLIQLKSILSGETTPNFPVDRKRAIALLARSDDSIETTNLLIAILSNPNETETNRSLVALNLSKMPPEIAEKGLLKNLRNENLFVRAEILKSLAVIGTNLALEQLNKLTFPGDLNSQRELSLAKLLINVRTNPADLNLGTVRESLGIQWSDQKAKPIKGKALKTLISQLGGRNFNISLNTDVGFTFDCAGLNHSLLLNSKLKPGEYLSTLRQTALIAGIVVAETEEIAHSTPRFIVFSFPSDKGIEIIVTRVNGEAIYNGIAAASDNGLVGALRDVGVQRTPAEIDVVINSNTIQISSRLWQGRRRQKNSGRAFAN